jgi:hypothetical protein
MKTSSGIGNLGDGVTRDYSSVMLSCKVVND